MLSLVLDGLIALLLVLTLGLGFRLHQGLRRLRLDDAEFDRVIAALDGATDRAGAALDGLRQTAALTGAQLTGDLAKAQKLLDDLRFLTDRGEQLADRLAGQIERARSPGLRSPGPRSGAQSAPPASPGAPAAPPALDLERALRTLR